MKRDSFGSIGGRDPMNETHIPLMKTYGRNSNFGSGGLKRELSFNGRTSRELGILGHRVL